MNRKVTRQFTSIIRSPKAAPGLEPYGPSPSPFQAGKPPVWGEGRLGDQAFLRIAQSLGFFRAHLWPCLPYSRPSRRMGPRTALKARGKGLGLGAGSDRRL